MEVGRPRPLRLGRRRETGLLLDFGWPAKRRQPRGRPKHQKETETGRTSKVEVKCLIQGRLETLTVEI